MHRVLLSKVEKLFIGIILLSSLVTTVYAAPEPSITTNLNQQGFIGEVACFEATFSHSNETGYGPYLLMTLPGNINPSSVSASLFDGSTTASVTHVGAIDGSTVPPTYPVNPYDNSPTPPTYTTPDPGHLLAINLPLGSMTSAVPPIVLDICLAVPDDATQGDTLPIQLTPGYRYGDSPTGTDTITGTPSSASAGITPVLAMAKKANTTPDGENTPGLSYPFNYLLAVDIAEGETLENIVITDNLPANVQRTAAPITIGGQNPNSTSCSVTESGTSGGGGTVTVTCSSLTGVANPQGISGYIGGDDIRINIPVYTRDILDETACSAQSVTNSMTVNAEQDDGTGTNTNVPIPSETTGYNAVTAALQKVTNNSTPNPGESITYTLKFQISDHTNTANNTAPPSIFNIVDTLPDGLSFTSSSATLNIGGSSTPITPTSSITAGVTTLTYDVLNNAPANSLHAGSRGSITYTATVAQSYDNSNPVAANDSLTNNATLHYQLADNTSTACTNTDSATVRVTEAKPKKTVLNATAAPFQAGDIIYYQVQIKLDSGDAKAVKLTDILPLPAHSVTNGDVPAVGNLTLGSSANQTDANNYVYHANISNINVPGSGVIIQHYPPNVSLDTTGNAVKFDFGDITTTPTQPVTLTVNIPAKVSDKPFADDLSLTNLLQASSANSVGTSTVAAGVGTVTTIAPVVKLTKGVLSTSNTNSTINPTTTTLPVDGDLTDADAGDNVTYRLTVENTGKGKAFDVVATDTIPAELQSCSVANVTQGNGTVLASTDYTTSITASQVQVTLSNNIISGGGALNSNDETPAGGGEPYSDDTVFIDIACTLADSVTPGQVVENKANITWASAVGADTYPNQEDTASVTIAQPDVSKIITAVSPNATNTSDFSKVTAGDTVTYDITVTLPEGTTTDLTLTDTLPAGLTYVASSVEVIFGSFTGTLSNSPTVSTSGQNVTATFSGNTIATGTTGTANNTFVLRLKALVTDAITNDGLPSAQNKSNSVKLTYSGQTGAAPTATAVNRFVEPQLAVKKFRTPSGSYAVGDWVTFRFRVRNTGTGRAYDVIASDVLDANVFDLNSVQNDTAVAQMAGFAYAYDATSGTVTFSQQTGQSLAVGTTKNFKIKVKIKAGVPSHATFANTVNVVGDSQDGAVSGERESKATNSITLTTDKAAVLKTILNTSETWTDTPEIAIGEVVTYQVVYNIPEGQTLAQTTPVANLIFQDDLPVGFSYLNGSAKYYGVYDGNLSASNLISASNLSGVIPTVATSVPTTKMTIGNANRQLRFLFGDITNSDNDGEASVEQIILTYQAIVQNTTNNNRTDTKTNTAKLRYRRKLANNNYNNKQITSASSVAIAEPNLSISKTASPTTADGGDMITFTVEITNPAGTNVTRAWDVVAKDPLPGQYDQLVLDGTSGTSVTMTTTDTTRAGYDWLSCSHITSGALQWDFDMNNCSSPIPADQHYLAPEESITIVYKGRLSPTVAFGANVINTAEVKATSLPGTNGTGGVTTGAAGTTNGERTGSGGTNDLVVTDNATVSIKTPSITKTVTDNTLQIGEISTMTLNISLPVGTTDNFIITDVFPTGLRYTGGDITLTKQNNLTVSGNNVAINSSNHTLSNGANIISGTAAVNGDGSNASLTFAFGSIVVANTVGTGDGITITYPVQVQNISSNQRNASLTNTAQLAYNGVSTSNPPKDTATITVLEPNIEVAKSITQGAAGSVAGDTISYKLIIRNTDPAATAYRVKIADVVPPQLLGGSPTISSVTLTNNDNAVLSGTNTAVVASDHSISTTTNSDDTLSLPLVDMPPSSTLTLAYQVKVTSNAPVGANLSNALAVDYHSLPAGLPNSSDGRDGNDIKDDEDTSKLNNYGEQTSKTLTLDSSIALQKSMTNTPPVTRYAIGETVKYDLKVNILEGTSNDVVITDTLPVGMSFVSVDNGLTVPTSNTGLTYSAGTVTAGTSGSGTTADPTKITINLGNIVNTPDTHDDNDYVIVHLTLRVDNHVNNDNNGILTNTATVTSSNAGSATDTQDITVVEPIIAATKTASNSTPALGEVVTFTVKVKHQSGSNSTAYDIVLKDTLPSGMSYVAGSISGPVGCTPTPCASIAAGTTPLTFTMGSLTQTDNGDGSKTFTYKAKVADTATVGSGLTNSISGTYTSMAGSNSDERTGSGTPAQNDYTFTATATVTPDTNAVIDAKKTVAIVVDNGTTGVADVGDTLEYTVILKNTSATAVTNVVFTDAIPANTTLVSNSLTSTTGTTTEGNPLIVNNIATLAPNATVTISFRVTINASTAKGTVISNQGSVDSNETVPEPTDVDGVDANGDQPTDITVGGNPDLANPLYAEKAVELWNDTNSNGVVNAGDTLRYTIVLNNRGNTPLTAVSFNDTIPAGLSYVNATAVASSGTATVSGQTLNWTGITTIPTGGFVNLVFDVTVNSFTGADTTFDNQGDVSYTDGTTNKTTKTDSNGNSSDGNQPTTITATIGSGTPKLDVQKRVALATDANGDSLANPNDTLTYTISIVNNGSAATNNARFSDTIPTQTTLVSGSVTTDYGVVTSGNSNPIKVNLGSLQPGEVATISFTVTIKPNTGGETAANQARVTANNLSNPVLSDDNGNSVDGINPTLTPIYDNSNTPPAAVTKTIVATDQTASSGNDVLIGEIVTYEVSVPMPAGNLAQATIIDTLPNGLGYVANSAMLKRQFSTGLNASANPNGINTAANNSYVNLTDGTTWVQNGQALSVFLGDVINSDTTLASYTLRYQAVVKNIAGNVNNTPLSNSAQLNYLNALNQTANLAADDTTVTVKEPHVTISKTAAPDVVLTSGGTVVFTLVVENDGTAPAYDINVSDTMPSGWTIANVNTGGSATNNSTATTLNVVINQLAIGATQTLTVTATAPSGLADGATITNTAATTWSSLPATPANSGNENGERTGGSGSGSNGYTNNDSASVTVGTPNLSKTVVNAQPRYAIGDIVDYQLTLSVPAGLNMADSLIRDMLDNGLQYVDNSLVVSLDGLTLTAQPSDFTRVENTANGTETLTFDTNGIRNNQSDTRTLTLTYSARVENIIDNQNNHVLNNAATLAYTNPGDTSQTLNLTDNQDMTVGEPHLALSKSITTPTTNLQAGDTVTYEITVENNGTTTAFDTVLRDSLPSGLENITALNIDSTVPPTLAPPTLTITGNTWESTAFDLGTGESLTLRFTATLANSVTPGDTLQNRVTAEFSSQSGVNANERSGDLSDTADQDDNSVLNNYDLSATSATITVDDPIQFDKAFHPTGKTTYTIGELVNYRLTLQLAQGTLDNVVIEDTLPSGLSYISGSVSVGHTQITASNGTTITASGQVITADLGQVINPANNIDSDDFIHVDITARVDNITANQNNTVLGNTAEVRYTDANGNQIRVFDADASTFGNQPLDLTLIEPQLNVGKTASVSEISLGDVVTYEITVAHTADSTATAYNVVITDLIPAGMTYVANSGTPTPSVSGQTLTFTVPSLPSGSTTISYQARMNTDTAVGNTQTNHADLSYASLPNANGDADSGRNGKDGSGNLNDYVGSATAAVTPTANAVIDAQKTVALSNDTDGDGVADSGETLSYSVIIENTHVSDKVTHVVFTDTLPAETTFAGNLTAVGSASAAENNGVITVNYDELAAGASVTVTFDVVINSGTAVGTLISNQGSIDSNETVPEPTDQDGDDSNGDQPTDIRVGGDPTPDYDLTADKRVTLLTDTDGNNVVSPGDRLRYTIVLKNNGSQTLTGLTFSDSIPDGLTHVANNPDSGSVTVSGQDLTWVGIADLAAGAAVTLTFDVSIDSFATSVTTETFVNQGTANSNETNATATDSNGDSTDGKQPTTISATDSSTAEPLLDVQKRVSLLTDNNANGVANPADQLRYTITVSNVGAVTAENSGLSDSIPAYTTLVDGSVTTSHGIVSSGNADPIDINLGNLAVGDMATVSFVVTVDGNTPNATVIANQAVVNADNLNTAISSDDNGNAGDGVNPTLTPIYDDNSTPPTAVSKTVVADSESDSVTPKVLIGEVITYEVTLTVPSGHLAQASIIDTLPSGLSYVTHSAKLKRVFNTGLNASANPNAINTATTGDYVNLSDGTTLIKDGQKLSVFLGDVINSATTSASYALQYQAVVKNIAGNINNTTLSNSATLGYLNGLNQPQTLTPIAQNLTVTEPTITLSKTAAPNVILTTGGTVKFTLLVKNDGTAPAYDINVKDTMPGGWTIHHVDLGGSGSNNSTATELRAVINQLTPNASQTIIVTATAPAHLAEGATMTNTASTTWTSLPGNNARSGNEDGERTGGAGSGSNGYTIADTTTVTVGTPNFSKIEITPKSRYAIGDTAKYQLAVTLPAGLHLANAKLTDVLDKGLQYVDGSLSVNLDGLTLATQPTDFTRSDNTPTVGKETLVFDTQGIQNGQNQTRTLTLTYLARVENIIDNQNNVPLGNQAYVAYTNPGNLSETLTLGSYKNITVGEPHLQLTKEITSPTSNLDAGDTVTYKVTLANDGTATAFDTVLSDRLPVGLENITNLTIDSTLPATLIRPTFMISGNRWTSTAFHLGVDESLTLSFTVTLADSVIPGETLQNRVYALYHSQSSTTGRSYRINRRNSSNPYRRSGNLSDTAEQDDNTVLNNYDLSAKAAVITVADPIQFNKAFNPQAKTTYTIGELVNYRLTLQLAQGTLHDVIIRDMLPAGLTFVSGSVRFGNTGITTSNTTTLSASGQVITSDLGKIVNPANNIATDDFITVDLTARVDNITANQTGTILGNHAEVNYRDADGEKTRAFDADNAVFGNQPLNLTLIEPDLAITKTASSETVSLGDVVTYTISLAHTGNSRATAYETTVTDTIPSGMEYVTDSGIPAPTVSGQTLTFALAGLPQSTANRSFIYKARMKSNTAIGVTQTNKATLTYASLPNANGNADNGRNGKDGIGQLNDYVNKAVADVKPTASSRIDAGKTVAIVNDVDGDGKADVGDKLRYTVTLKNTGNKKVSGVVFTDTLPTNTTYVNNSLVASGSVSASESNGVITVNYNELPAGAMVLMTFDVSINAGTATGTVISNQGSVDSNETVPEPTDQDSFDDNGDQPTNIRVGGAPTKPLSLAVSKTYTISNDNVLPVGTNNVGDEVTYTLVIRNTGSQALTNVVFTDNVPSSVSVTAVTSSKGVTVIDNNVSINLGTLAVGEQVSIRIVGILNRVGQVDNQATVSSKELANVLSDSDGNPDNGAQPVSFPVLAANQAGASNLQIDKTMVLAIDTNSDTKVNPGESVKVSLTISNRGSATAQNVQLHDDLSSLNADVLTYSATASQGVIVNRVPILQANLGNILAGSSANVTFIVLAKDIGTIDNTATATDNSGQSVSDTATIDVTALEPFDPPSGEKVVNADGIPELAWKQVWINPNDSYFMPVRIVDGIPTNSTYVADSIACEARGISTQSRCEFDTATQQVIFEGKMGADGKATTETTAKHEVVITFRVKVDNLSQQVSNQAKAMWDANGNGDLSDDSGVAVSNDPNTGKILDPTIWKPKPIISEPEFPPTPVRIPILGWQHLLLMLLFFGVLGIYFLRDQTNRTVHRTKRLLG